MKKVSGRLVVGSVLLLVGVFLLAIYFQGAYPAFSPANLPFGNTEACHVDGRVFSIKDGQNNLISKMSRLVSVGDKVITHDGKVYRINKISGHNAVAKYEGLDHEFLAWQDYFTGQAVPVTTGRGDSNRVAIYHTHSEESYVPTDGSESKPGNGGIFQVGKALASRLEQLGVEPLHDRSVHEPRDDNSYNRSRRTATKLLERNPVCLLDVHRDGVPDANYYSKQVNGQNVTQLRLVIGRQNPKMQSNLDFAKKVMAAVNKQYPKLVKEIFIANGNYNQDLTPTALLLEVGTHTNTRDAAEKGISFFGSVLPGVMGIGAAGAKEGTYGDPNARTPGGWSALILILAVLAIGGGAFALVSSGSWRNLKDRLNSYIGKEMVNLILPKKIARRRAQKDKEYDPDASEKAKQRLDDIRKD